MSDLDAEIASDEAELAVLQRVAERYDLVIEPSAAENAIVKMDRTAAVEHVLSLHDGLSPQDVMERLHDLGRDDNYHAVSAALAYLKRMDRAHTPERALWKTGPASQPELDADDALITDDGGQEQEVQAS